ncbi:hypothetical protein [Miniphocaeibacter massiliensis]|uniref:hypothetical protein n=1 Tax=Miniphocaeibacter massiliensis TaxID=2041841 RepID=UPI000C1B85E7|nr:hypothetical protein [Miniphocaeibacter massiliensis]
MVVLIDERESLFVILRDKDEVREYVNERLLEIDCTSPRDFEPRAYVYNAFLDDDWEKTIKYEFEMSVVKAEFKEEIEF